LIVELKDNIFNLTVENNLTDYLSCCVIKDVELNQNLERKSKGKEFIKLLRLQVLKLFAQTMKLALLIQMYRAKTVLNILQVFFA
jgi:hypothetical protein